MQKPILVKIKKVIGVFYPAKKVTPFALVGLAGAPGFGDTGNSQTAKIANKLGVSVFKPDYIGMSRSDGKFNFKNCLETIKESTEFLQGQIIGYDIDNGRSMNPLGFKRIILLGSSFGGSVASFVGKLGKTAIQDVILVAPVSDWKTQNPPFYKGDENAEQFIRIMSLGFKNVWRGFTDSLWPKIIRGKLKNFNPIDNTQLLAGKRVFLFHGAKDKTISWKDTFVFFQKLQKENLVKKVSFQKLLNSEHSPLTTALGVKIALKKIMAL